MASLTSQNGWAVYSSSSGLADPGYITGKVRPGNVEVIFEYLLYRYHREVEPIVKGHSWGWAYRPVSGQTSGFSNHASATAVDINAPAHPLGVKNTFTAAEIVAVRRILADIGAGVLRWGEDYTGRKDGMHFEIDANSVEVAIAADRIRKIGIPGLPMAPTPAVVWDASSWDGKSFPGAAAFKVGVKSPAVKLLQERLQAHGYWVGSSGIDSYWGEGTAKALAMFRVSLGWMGSTIVPEQYVWGHLMGGAKPKPQVSVIRVNNAMKSGAKSDDVRIVQEYLRLRYGSNLKADGYWGSMTTYVYNAARKLMGYSGSDATGSAGAESLGKLFAGYITVIN